MNYYHLWLEKKKVTLFIDKYHMEEHNARVNELMNQSTNGKKLATKEGTNRERNDRKELIKQRNERMRNKTNAY